MQLWSVPPVWSDRAAAYVLGGGPSLCGFDVERLRGRGHVIAVNSAYRLAPWADVLYFADCLWLTGGTDKNGRKTPSHVEAVRAFRGLKVTREPTALQHVPQAFLVARDKSVRLGIRPAGGVAGLDSGTNAINLAWLLGARKRIVLLGFDMRPNGHWHNDHGHAKPETFSKYYVPGLQRMADALREMNCLLLNASPGSALTGVAGVPLDDLPLP